MAITRQTTRYKDDEIHKNLNPLLSAWFKWKFGKFTEPQKYSIMSIHRGENTLVSAETGTGKTLSAFTSVLSELITLSENGQLEDRVYCVYVSPLRALNNDIERNLLEPLDEIKKAAKKINKKIDIRVGVRTGDTTTSQKSAMLRKPPHILITTPESLAIVLNAPKFVEKLKGARWMIVDEIHALAGGKRGMHLSLTMERLQRYCEGITRIGLSATIAPLEEMAKYLAGMEDGKNTRPCKIVDVSFLKKMDLKVVSPLKDYIDVTPEQIHKSLYGMLHTLIQGHKTTLVFTNTRSATERVVHNLKEMYPKYYTKANLEAHHSSVSREQRLNVERRLKEGKLKGVVCSTSLELGIDIGYVDLVVLISSPKSIARAVQRIGRSGHRLHDEIKGRILVMDRDDLVECAVLVKKAREKEIDRISIPMNALDVLAQQIFGIAIEDKIHIDELYRLARKSYCYHTLARLDFNEVIDYLRGEYVELEHRSVYAKIWLDEETGMIGKRGKMARIIYMTNIGTIPDEAKITVKIGNNKIGTIDEGFLMRLKKGDVFVLGGETYIFKFTRGMTAQVGPAYKRPPTVPQWFSEMLPLSFDLAVEIGKFRELMEEKFAVGRDREEILAFIGRYLYAEDNAAEAIYNYFYEQYRFAEIPNHKKIIMERYKDGGSQHIVFHTLYGRRTNDALSRAYGYALSHLIRRDVEITINDNGFVISPPWSDSGLREQHFAAYAGSGQWQTLTKTAKLPLDRALKDVTGRDLRKMLELAIEHTEVLARRFRHCATRSLMILRTYKGRKKSAGKQQMSSRLLLSAVRRISEDFPILREARREVLEDLMDIGHAQKVIEGIEQGKIKIKEINTELPSPFALNIAMQGKMDLMKMEDKLDFVRRMHKAVMERIGAKC